MWLFFFFFFGSVGVVRLAIPTVATKPKTTRGLGLDTSEEAQVERAGDLDGFQGEGGGVEGEGDRVNHLCVHQQLGTLATVSQASL